MGYGLAMASASRSSRAGRRPKPERRQHTVRMPADHYELYAQRAAAVGLDVNEYLVVNLAAAHGLAVPDYIRPRSGQEAMLPMAG